MKGAIRPLVTMKPLRSTCEPQGESQHRHGQDHQKLAVRHRQQPVDGDDQDRPDTATIEPTEGLSLPAMITKVIPRAMIPVYDTWRRMLTRF
jgi:hypothetical protein